MFASVGASCLLARLLGYPDEERLHMSFAGGSMKTLRGETIDRMSIEEIDTAISPYLADVNSLNNAALQIFSGCNFPSPDHLLFDILRRHRLLEQGLGVATDIQALVIVSKILLSLYGIFRKNLDAKSMGKAWNALFVPVRARKVTIRELPQPF
jgi:hypothetical protein